MKIDFNVILEDSAAKNRNDFVKCFADREMKFTFADIELHSRQIACWMLDKGIKAGDRIALWMGNCPEFLLLFAAGLRIGAVLVPINVYLSRETVNQFCEESDCKILFWDSGNQIIRKQEVQDMGKWSLEGRETVDLNAAWEDSGEKKRIRMPFRAGEVKTRQLRCERESTDDLVILYTSGSTGEVKAVRKSTKSYFGKNGFPKVFSNAIALGRKLFCLSVFNTCPWYHNTGIYMVLITLFGVVYQEITVERFQPQKVLGYLETYVPKVWLGTATMLHRCCISGTANPDKMPKLIVSSGEELSYHVIRTIISSCKSCYLYSGYGTTETGSISYLCYKVGHPSRLIGAILFVLHKMGYFSSVWDAEKATEEKKVKNLGEIVPSVQVVIRDTETNTVLKEGQAGEICVYSNMVMNGYMGKEKSEIYYFCDEKPFVRTGDLGYVKDGCLYLAGRLKNLIIRSGENIVPGEIEQRIAEYPNICDVVVCGVPSECYGESVCANLQCADAKMDLEPLREKLKRELPKYMVPEYYVIWEEFPLNASGKTDVKKIREEAGKHCAVSGGQAETVIYHKG